VFRIHQSQFETLARHTRQEFVKMMAAYVRDHFSGQLRLTLEAQREAWVSVALEKCERYGIATEPEAAQLILLFLVLGLSADEEPWVHEILEDPRLTAIGKLRRLVRVASDRGIKHLDEVVVCDDL